MTHAGGRPGRQEADRVGVLRIGEELRGRRAFDDPAGIHHRHLVAGLGHHAEVVRDQQERGLQPAAQVGEQFENLRLDRDVECRGGFVGDHEIGFAGQRYRDHHPLSHAARQLVRIFVEPLLGIGQPYQLQHLQRPRPRGRPRNGPMQQDGLSDLIPDREHWVEARHRLLEDHADATAANLAELRLGQLREIDAAPLPGEQDFARLDHAGRRHQPENRHRRHALAAAALADEAERFPAFDRQRHAIHRRHAAGRGVKRRHEVVDFEEWHESWRQAEACPTFWPRGAADRSLPGVPRRSGCRPAR